MKEKLKGQFRKLGDVLIVKILDMTNQVFYTKRVSVSDKKGIAQIIQDLDAYGIDLKKIGEEKRWW